MAGTTMANRRIVMRKIRQVLRLALEQGMSKRAIAKSLGVSRDAVTDYVTRALAAGVNSPIPPELDDAYLERLLFPSDLGRQLRRPEPSWEVVHQDMKAKGATLQILHQEYLEAHPDGMGYSHYCGLYRQWQKTLKRYMRQPHTAGERAFVDYAGPTIAIHDMKTGEVRTAQIFVGILGASNYTYAEAHWSQKLPNWIAAHVRMFEFFGGAPQIVVCDNLKPAVTRASRTEPVIHSAYQHLAAHYSTVILPARPRQPKDKAKVENAVLIVERWILFRLRKRIFTSLAEANEAIAALLQDLNNRPFQKLAGCRRSQFETIDLPALQPLPAHAFEYTEFRRVRIGMDGLFEVDGTPYNTPFMLSGKVVDLRITPGTVEVLYQGQRAASHERKEGSTPVINALYLRPADRHFGQWSPDESLTWAAEVGAGVRAFIGKQLAASAIKEHGYRTTTALKKIHKMYGSERLDAACARANEIGASSLSSIRSILRTKLDQQVSSDSTHQEATFHHPNVRGPDYYH
ncbi:IS21 family transposase [Rhodoferax sp.]|uniref:IS21 family transposase n=1 Tax=Rhodoferax sp. TaxID=50421 RepID=UPI002ACE89AD|nr:IS21 family transposase [Rhodoferax sp.]MDZ7921692.1 IS21 family transposase [Rhodoferax sp.]